MSRKLHDELKFLTSGVATTGLEYIKHRKKKKKLRGGFLGLLAMAALTVGAEVANHFISKSAEETAREAEYNARKEEYEKQKRAEEAERQERLARIPIEEARARNVSEKIQQTGNVQTQKGDKYQTYLQQSLDAKRRQEQAFYESQDLERKSYDAQMAEQQRSMFEGDTQLQNLSAAQRRLEIQQEEQQRLYDVNSSRLSQAQQQFDYIKRATNQRYDLELQQRLRSAQAQKQAQSHIQQQRSRRIVAAKSTAQKVGRRW
jgi:hypothetical protein